jgi:hypothetical protein
MLPAPLIPYHRHGLTVMLETVSFHHRQSATIEQTKSFISDKGIDTDMSLENNQIKDFLKLCSQAWLKLHTIVALQPHMNQACSGDHSDPVGALLKFIKSYTSPLLTTRQLQAAKVEQLALDFFYHLQTGDYFDRHFLFGTASQKLAV